jgi:hypothetical protein
MRAALGWLWRGGVLGIFAFLIFGPLANLVLWAVATQWYFPHKLPLTYGFRYWGEVFKPTSDAFASLGTSVLIAAITVLVCLLLAIPAGYALGRRSLPGRGLILLIILLPQAFPSVAVYLNIARLFYMVDRDRGTPRGATHRVTGGGRPPPVPTERGVRICRVAKPLLAFAPTEPTVRRYRSGLFRTDLRRIDHLCQACWMTGSGSGKAVRSLWKDAQVTWPFWLRLPSILRQSLTTQSLNMRSAR